MMMEWNEEAAYLLLKPEGRLDAVWFQKWGDAFLERTRNTAAHLILVDLRNTDYASSAFLRFLILLQKEAATLKQIMLISPQPTVRQILKIAGFDALFHIATDPEQAIRLWRSNSESLPAVREDGVNSEFTSNGYFHFSGNLPSTARLFQTAILVHGISTLSECAGLSPTLCVGAGISASTEDACYALVFGKKMVLGKNDGPVQVLPNGDTDLTDERADLHLETVVFDRLDDIVDFGCRWPDKGVPFSDLAFDLLRLARERRREPGHATGFLMIYDHPGKRPADNACIVHVASGVMFGKEDMTAFARPLTGAWMSDKCVGLYGVKLELTSSKPFDFRGPDLFHAADHFLRTACIREIGPLDPGARVVKATAGLTCFSQIIG
jgi:anti-anti-sigma factor